MQTLQRKQEMKIVNLTWLIFPYWLSDFFPPKISGVQAVDNIDSVSFTKIWPQMATFPLLPVR